MKPHIQKGDIREWAKNYDGPKFHACFCDAPYELSFMGRAWDNSGISFQKETWELIRQHLYPGAFLFCFGGTRTYHRIAVAIEDAGFEIRDTIAWAYGQGFPKSYNIAKGIEGKLVNGTANWSDWKKLEGERKEGNLGYTKTQAELGYRPDDYTGRGSAFDLDPTTKMAEAWQGYGTALKPGFEPIIVAMNPVDESFVNNALKHGVSGLNIDAGRIGTDDSISGSGKGFLDGKGFGNIGYGEKTSSNIPQNSKGRWPANLLLSHSPDCRIIGETDSDGYTINRFTDGAKPFGNGAGHEFESEEVSGGKKYVWECVESCAVRKFGEQGGVTKSGTGAVKNQTSAGHQGSVYGKENRPAGTPNVEYGDQGSVSRFFYQTDWSYEILEQIENANSIYYCPKVSVSEREAGLEDFEEKRSDYRPNDPDENSLRTRLHKSNPRANHHPTLKPISLGIYLVGLLSPPLYCAPRRLLIPFSGVGSEICSAILHGGFEEVVGVEREEEYVQIAEERCRFWNTMKQETGSSDPRAILKIYDKMDKEKQDSLESSHGENHDQMKLF